MAGRVLQAIDQEKHSLRQSLLTANASTQAAQARLEEEIADKAALQHRVDELAAISLSLEDRWKQTTAQYSAMTDAIRLGTTTAVLYPCLPDPHLVFSRRCCCILRTVHRWLAIN